METVVGMNSFWRDRSVFVTGATGLLGSWLVSQLLDADARVVCLVRDWSPKSERMQSHKEFRSHSGDDVEENLITLCPDISYALGNYETGDPYYALDLQVAPGAPHTTAVTRGANVDPAAQGGIMIFDDSTPRPITTPGDGYPGGGLFASIQWGADTTALYAANSESTGYDFYTLTVSSTGVVLNQDYSGVFWNPGRIRYDRGTGLVYSEDGFHAINSATGLPAGLFEVGEGTMIPDSTLNTAFFISQYGSQENSNYTLNLFDMTHYTPVNRIPFSTTFPAAQDTLNPPNRLIRWGANGLAEIDTQGHIYLISGSFVSEGHNSRARTNKAPNSQ